MIDNRLGNFLKELSHLTKKYNISIGGCGCCGSPYLTDLETDECLGEELGYDGYKYLVDIEGE